MATSPKGSWRWVDGTSYSQAQRLAGLGEGGTGTPGTPLLTPLCSGSFWAPGQPDNTDHGQWGQESCAQIHPVRNGLWNDHNCNFTFAWICKRDLNIP